MRIQVARDIAIAAMAGNTSDIDVVPHPLERFYLMGAGGVAKNNRLIVKSHRFRNETTPIDIAHWFAFNGGRDVIGGIGQSVRYRRQLE